MLKRTMKYIIENRSSLMNMGLAVVTFMLFAIDPAWADADARCKIEEYHANYETCVFCDLFTIVFNTASVIAAQAYATFAYSVRMVVIVGMAVWLGVKVMKHVSSWEVKDPRQLMKEILNQAFLVLVVLAFLQMGSKGFMSLFMEPIFNTGFNLALLAIGGDTCSNAFGILEKGGGLPSSMGINVVCVIMAIQKAIMNIAALGSTSLCIAFFIESWKNIPIFPHIGYLIIGLVLWIAALLMLIIYPFLLVDTVLQMAVAVGLLPAALGCYAFKITQKYVSKVFETIMNCMFSFVFLSIIIYILTNEAEHVVSEGLTSKLDQYANDQTTFLEELSWSGIVFIKLVFIILLTWAVMGSAQEFAGQYAGSSFSVGGIGRKVGGAGASAAKKLGDAGGKLGWKVGGKTAGAILSPIKGGIRSVRHGITRRRLERSNDKDAYGNKVLTTKNWRGQTITRTMAADAGKNAAITKTKVGRKGNVVSTVHDKYMRMKTITDKDGNLKASKITITSSLGNDLVRKDGSINTNAMALLQQKSSLNKDVVNQAIMEKIVKENLPGVNTGIKSKFESRSFQTSTDENGNAVFKMTQINKGGEKIDVNITLSAQKGRARAEVKKSNANGVAQESFTSDGIVKKHTAFRTKDGVTTSKDKYEFTNHYMKKTSAPISSRGKFSSSIPMDQSMYSNKEIKGMVDQFMEEGFGNDDDDDSSKKKGSSGDEKEFL